MCRTYWTWDLICGQGLVDVDEDAWVILLKRS